MAFVEWKLITALSIMATITDVGTVSEELIKIDDCTCPGDIIIYNCSVIGSGFTIWRGSAFNCPVGILLRHSSFGASGGTMGSCNDGAIIGHSSGIGTNSMNNSVYMSQLMINLTASSGVVDQTVECVYRNPAGVETTIGSATIDIADPPSPPTNIQLVGVSPEQLVFNWTSVDSNCSTLQYNVVSNCGTCPDTVDSAITSLTCSIDLSAFADNMTLCSFAIKSVVCSNISGISSSPLDVTLKVPQSPIISSVIPHYREIGSNLISFDLKFSEVGAFMISNGVDGSALYYTISYTDSNAGDFCGDSLTIPASFCMQGICTVNSIGRLPCSEAARDGNIDISVSASNLLGSGPSSSTTIGQINKYVNVTFESTNKVVCAFLAVGQQTSQSTISCDFAYGPCLQHPTMIAQGTINSSNTVNIDLPDIPLTINEYCYTVNASNGTFSILIEGVMKPDPTTAGITIAVTTPGDESQSNHSIDAIIGSVVPISALIIGGLLIIIVTAIIYWKCKQYKIRKFNTDFSEELDQEHLLPHRDSTHSDTQNIRVHICFDLEDKPRELMKVLTELVKLKINFKNIKIGPCEMTSDNTDDNPPVSSPIGPYTVSEKHNTKLSVRTIYIECENDLTDKEKKDIEDPDLKIGIAGTLSVCCVAEFKQYTKGQSHDVEIKRSFNDITEYLEHKPGALLSLLEVVYSVEECEHINITDIDIVKLQDGSGKCYSARVIITFLPDMAIDWKDKYNIARYKCKSIVEPVKPPDTEGTTV